MRLLLQRATLAPMRPAGLTTMRTIVVVVVGSTCTRTCTCTWRFFPQPAGCSPSAHLAHLAPLRSSRTSWQALALITKRLPPSSAHSSAPHPELCPQEAAEALSATREAASRQTSGGAKVFGQ